MLQTATSGDTIQIAVYSDAALTQPTDLSTATSVSIIFKGPGLAATTVTGTVTGTSHNIIQVIDTINTFTVAGNWYIQGLIVWADTTVSKTPQSLLVVQQALA